MSGRRRRRGYPVAVLVGLRGLEAVTWHVYSEAVRPGVRVQGEDEYGFYEMIVDALRPSIKDGIRSVLVAAPDEREYRRLMDHIGKHQGWLLKGWSLNTVSFEYVPEAAMEAGQVRALVASRGFDERLGEVTEGDVRQVMDELERRLNDPAGIETLLFTLDEVEGAVYGEGSPEYILVTEFFMSRHGRRVNRLLQVAANRDVKTRVIGSDSPAGGRLAQFGGLVCLLKG